MVNSIDRIPSLYLVSFFYGMESLKSFIHIIAQSFRLRKDFKSIALESVTNYKKALQRSNQLLLSSSTTNLLFLPILLHARQQHFTNKNPHFLDENEYLFVLLPARQQQIRLFFFLLVNNRSPRSPSCSSTRDLQL